MTSAGPEELMPMMGTPILPRGRTAAASCRLAGVEDSAAGISVVIPAYNEAASIPVIIPKLQAILSAQQMPFEIIVVNDGSTDGTAELARAYGIVVIDHPHNRGYGNS